MEILVSRVLALVDYSPVTPVVIRTATAVAAFLGVELDVIHVDDASTLVAPRSALSSREALRLDEAAELELVEMLGAPDVVCGVLGSRSMLSTAHRVGHVAEFLLEHVAVPLVVVPPDAPDFDPAHPTVLVPHDDSDATAEALRPAVDLLSAAGAEFVVLHVFDNRSVPLAVSSHDLDTIADEFLHRHHVDHPQRCELRIGHAGSQIAEVASGRDIDAVLLVWRQQTGPGRADVITHLVRECEIPLIVVPFSDEPDNA